MAIKYVPFYPDPIEGQAILDNFARTRRVLKYRDNDRIVETLRRGMPLYEMELQERVGENKDGNLVIRGECVSACAYLKEKGIEVDLVYIDPPFASGAVYAKKVYIRKNPKVAELITKAQQEMSDNEFRDFEEAMYGDVWDKEKYLNWIYENLIAIKSIMSAEASIFVHLDYHIVHYVKVILDEIFGEHAFQNEIIWQRTDPHNDAKNQLGRVHDTIFWYSISEKPLYDWSAGITPLSASALKEYSLVKLVDGAVVPYKDGETYPESARRFKLDDCTWKGQSALQKFNWRGATPSDKRVWPYATPEEMDAAVERGEFYLRNPEKGAARCRVSFLDEREGQVLQTIWTDVGRMKGGSSYPTEKPFNLLDRIIRISSASNATVADFFAGSGVTAAAANSLGRRFITSDVGLNSIQITRDRLKGDGAEFDVLEIKDGVSLYRNPQQTMEKLKSLITGLTNEDSLDKFWEGAFKTTKEGLVPAYIPNLMDGTTKLLDMRLMASIIHEAIPDLPSAVKKVIVFYIDIDNRAEIEEFIAKQNDTGIEIELRDLKPVLDEVVVDDYAEFSVEETHDDLFGGWSVNIIRFMSDRVQGKINAYNEKANAAAHAKGKRHKPVLISEDGLELIEYVGVDCMNKDGKWKSDSEIKIAPKTSYVIRNGEKTKEFWDGAVRCEKKPLRVKIRNICGDESVWKV